jgi:hypothetical protein
VKLSHREILLGWITLVVVMAVLTWLWFEPRFEEVKDFSITRETSQDLARRARHLLDQKDEWDARLLALRSRLPRYREDQEVAADLLRGIERIARDNGFSLLRATPGQERRVGELFEVSIDYTWEGDLQALTGFLYAAQNQQVNMDIRQLNITPAPGAERGLRGQLTVDVAYTRGPPLTGGEPRPAEPPRPGPGPVSEDEEDDADEDEDVDMTDAVGATNDGSTLLHNDDDEDE